MHIGSDSKEKKVGGDRVRAEDESMRYAAVASIDYTTAEKQQKGREGSRKKSLGVPKPQVGAEGIYYYTLNLLNQQQIAFHINLYFPASCITRSFADLYRGKKDRTKEREREILGSTNYTRFIPQTQIIRHCGVLLLLPLRLLPPSSSCLLSSPPFSQ